MTHERRSTGADQDHRLHLPGGHTISPRPGADALEVLEAVLPVSHGGLADQHGPAITVTPWQATPRT